MSTEKRKPPVNRGTKAKPDDPNKKLTLKEQLFVKEYLVDLNSAAAARRAGYSEKTAREQGHRMLAKLHIARFVQQEQLRLQEKIEINQERVLLELAKIGFANISDFLTIKEEPVFLDDYGPDPDDEDFDEDEDMNEQKEPQQPRMVKNVDVHATDKVGREKMSAVSEVKQDRYGNISIKLHDKVAALEKIARHLGMFNDKLDLTSGGKGFFDFLQEVNQVNNQNTENKNQSS